jgi:hypothetical protein
VPAILPVLVKERGGPFAFRCLRVGHGETVRAFPQWHELQAGLGKRSAAPKREVAMWKQRGTRD